MKEINNAWQGASLTIYFDGVELTFDLSDTQFLAVAKLLGLQYRSQNSYDLVADMYSDNTLQQMLNMKGNPLKLKEQ